VQPDLHLPLAESWRRVQSVQPLVVLNNNGQYLFRAEVQSNALCWFS